LLLQRKKEEADVNLNEQAVYTELLTEQWKEEEADQAAEGGTMKSTGRLVGEIGNASWARRSQSVCYAVDGFASSTQIDLGDLNRARSGSDVK